MNTLHESRDRSCREAIAIIERKLEECAQKKQLHVSQYNWKLNIAHTPAAPHRLDIKVGSRTEKIYFTDRELAQCHHGHLAEATAMRLDRIIDRMSEERAPLPMLSSFQDLLAHVRP